jgi:hypothetical protein
MHSEDSKGEAMKKSLAKNLKLTLNRETLRILEDSALGAVDAAGTMRTVCPTCTTCRVVNTHCIP